MNFGIELFDCYTRTQDMSLNILMNMTHSNCVMDTDLIPLA